MDDIDLRKPLQIEKLSLHEHYLFQQKIRDLVSTLTLQCPKPIDRIAISQHASSFIDAGIHMREMAVFYREFRNLIPPAIMDPLMKSARKSFDMVRRNWLLTLTKTRDGVASAESFYSYRDPGMSDREHREYKKVLKDAKKNQNSNAGGGSTAKKQKFGRGGFNNKGRGRGGGGYNDGGNFHSGGGYQGGGGYDFGAGSFDPFQGQGQGEIEELLNAQNKILVEDVRRLRDQNLAAVLMIRALKLQSELINLKTASLKEEVTSLLLDVKKSFLGGIPFPPSYFKNSSSTGRGGHGGGGFNHGGFGGGYRGNNYRGRGGGGGGGSGHGGNQRSEGQSN